MTKGLIEKFTEEFRSPGTEEREQFISSSLDLILVLAEGLKINIGEAKHVTIEEKKNPLTPAGLVGVSQRTVP